MIKDSVDIDSCEGAYCTLLREICDHSMAEASPVNNNCSNYTTYYSVNMGIQPCY